MPRTCPRASSQGLITYSCLFSAWTWYSGSFVDHASEGLEQWRCAALSHNTKLKDHASQEIGKKVMQFYPTAVCNVTA